MKPLTTHLLPLTFILSLFFADCAHAAIAYVQSASKNSDVTTLDTLAFGSNNTAGNTIIVAVRQGLGTALSAHGVTITDSRGNTYYQVAQQEATADHKDFIFAAYNITAGANTVTCSFNGTPNTMRWAIHEYSGIQTLGAVDQTAGAEGTSATASSGNITTTYANTLLFGMASVNGDEDFTAGASFTEREQVVQKMSTEERIVSATGSYSASFSLSGSDTWAALIAAFKESDGLMGWWRLDEGGGATTADSSGNGWTGTITGGATWGTGRRGNGLSFDGVDGEVSISSSFDVPTLPFTMTAWVNPTNFGNWRKIFSKRDTFNAGDWRVDFELNNGNGRVRLVSDNATTTFTYSPPRGVWTHLAVVADVAATRLYVNGALQQSQGAFTLGTDAAAEVNLGTCPAGEDNFLGTLDDIRVYNRALSASEIAGIYVGGKTNNATLRNGKLNL